MGDYATATDVHAGALETISSSKDEWLEYQIEVAESLLKELVPRLADIVSVTPEDRVRARHVVVEAVLRYFRNPQGMKSETVDEQSFERFASANGETGIFFTERELARFRPAGKKRIGMIGVAPPKYGQI